MKDSINHSSLQRTIDGWLSYERVVEQSADAIIITNCVGDFLHINDTGLKLLGYTKEEIAKTNISEIYFKPEQRPKFLRIVKNKGIIKNHRGQIRRKNGEIIQTNSNVQVIKNDDNDIVGFQSIIRDVTDSVKILNSLKKSEQLFRTVSESLMSAIFLVQDCKFIYSNPAAEKILGYKSKELEGMSVDSIIHEDHIKTVQKRIKSLYGKKAVKKPYEIKFITKDNEERWGEISCNQVQYESSKTILGTLIDISIRKKYEEQLIKSKLKAEQSLKYKEEFITNVSHEIRTPMNAILGLTNLLSDTELNNKQEEYLNGIKLSAENLLSILNDILLSSKIQADKITLNLAPFDILNVVETSIQTMQFKADSKGLIVDIKKDTKIPKRLLGDRVKIGQIVMNLLDNAIKFTDRGRVEVSVSCKSISSSKANIELIITDTGRGIPSRMLDEIFDSFVQVQLKSASKSKGTGLGLYITKKLVELHNGQVTVESKLNKGTKFYINLPLRYVKSESISRSLSSVEKHRKTELKNVSILLVEDNKLNQLVAKTILTKAGARVIVASSGTSALLQLKKKDFEIVLLDLEIPSLSGFSVASKIRTEYPEPVKNIPIIAVTAHTSNLSRDKAFKSGVNDLIIKPYTPESLIERIQKLISMPPKSKESIEKISLDHLKRYTGENETLAIEITNAFIKQTSIEIKKLKNALLEKNWEQISKSMHLLKPSSGYLGLKKLSSLTEKIQKNNKVLLKNNRKTKQKEEELAALYISKLDKYCTELFRELEGIVLTKS